MAYTYLIGWSTLDKWYYGVRYKANVDPNELWVKYFTSSKYVSGFRTQHGEPDVIEIRQVFSDANTARNWESKCLRRIGVPKNTKFLNKTNNKAIAIEVRGTANERYLWFTDGKINKYCIPEESPNNMIRGRVCPWKGHRVKFDIDKEYPYNNGVEVKYFSLKARPKTKEWVPGTLPGNYKWNTRGKVTAYTNGTITKYLTNGDIPPDGFYPGRHWNFKYNGQNNPNSNTNRQLRKEGTQNCR